MAKAPDKPDTGVGGFPFSDKRNAIMTANNGIAFQTCYGANYLITHYEPGY